MQRGIDQADNHGQSGHGFEQAFEVAALAWQQFIQSCLPIF